MEKGPTLTPSDSELEVAIASGLEATVKYLQSDLPKERLKPEIEKLQTRTSDETSPQLNLKVEANALSGHFMKPIWENYQKWRAENPGMTGYFRDEDNEHAFQTVPFEPYARKHQHEPQEIFLFLYQTTKDTLQYHIETFIQEQRDDLEKPNTEWTTENKNFRRYLTVLEKNAGFEESDFERENPEILLQAGFRAAELVSHSIIEAIPRLYQEHFGQQISEEQLAHYLKKGRQMIVYFASMQLEVFRTLASEILQTRHEGEETVFFPLFNDAVTLNPDGKYPFTINEEALRRAAKKIKEHPIIEVPHTGCPALVVSGGSGSNLVTNLYDTAVDTAERYYYPAVLR